MLITVLIKGVNCCCICPVPILKLFLGERPRINHTQCSYEVLLLFKFVTNIERFSVNCQTT